MKRLPLCLLVLLFAACSSQRSSQNDLVSIEVQLEAEKSIYVKVPVTSPLIPTKTNGHLALLLGQLRAGSNFQMGEQSHMMTQISMQEAVSPESGFVDISEEREGKWALIRGHWAGDIYEAQFVCLFAKAPSDADLKAYQNGSKDILKDCR